MHLKRHKTDHFGEVEDSRLVFPSQLPRNAFLLPFEQLLELGGTRLLVARCESICQGRPEWGRKELGLVHVHDFAMVVDSARGGSWQTICLVSRKL